MKKIIYFLLLISLVSSCRNEDVGPADYFEPLSQDTLIFPKQGGMQAVMLKTNLDVEIVNEIDAWCGVEMSETSLSFTVSANDGAETRSGVVRLKTVLGEQVVYVRQQGSAPAIDLINDTFIVGTDSSILRVPIVSNTPFEVINEASWISYQGRFQGIGNDTLKFGISASKAPKRQSSVFLSYGQALSRELKIIQQSSDTVYQPASGDGVIRKLLVERAETSAKTISTQGIEKTHDGNFTNLGWFCTEDRVMPSEVPVIMTYYFKNPEKIDYLYYHPYSYSGRFEKFDLYIMTEGDSDFRKHGEYDFKGVSAKSQLKFSDGLNNVRAIQFRVKSASGTVGDGSFYVNCLEMEFYVYVSVPEGVFTDETCSELRQGVTYEQIMAIGSEFYRNLAIHLYSGVYETEFRVQEYPAYMNTDIQAEDHKALPWGLWDNQTGIYAEEGEDFIIFVGDTHGEQISLYVMDWEKTLLNNDFKKVALVQGTNRLKMPYKGLLYVDYNLDNPRGKQPIKIHIASGKVNGYFDYTRHTDADWKRLLANAKHRYFDVKGIYTNLLFETEAFRQACPDNGRKLTEVYDSIISMEHRLSGLFKYNRMIPNRMLCHVHYDNFYMYASQYRTAYVDYEQPLVCNPDRLMRDSWGVAHELGHVHQNKDLNWWGLTEISNNIYSMFVQRAFGERSRLIAEDHYQGACDQIAVPGQSVVIPMDNNPFAVLVPFWQLHLYFAEVLNQPDFYADILEDMRRSTSPATSGLKQMNFTLLACQRSNKDLTDFFDFWGFFTPVDPDPTDRDRIVLTAAEIQQVRDNIKALGKSKLTAAIHYLTDENIDLFRQNRPVVTGTGTLSGRNVTMSGWGNVVAYEVYKEGMLDKPVQISLKDQFELKEGFGKIVVMGVAADGTKSAVTL